MRQAEHAPGVPFVKWAGGKRQILPSILPHVPRAFDTYYEPFLGGGALFFALAARGGFRRAVLSDANPELVEAYHAVRDRLGELVGALRRHEAAHKASARDHYYEVRAGRPRTAVGRAARLIYLNRTGFNGLYRVNRKGLFNVPLGRYVNPRICDEPRLLAASRALAAAEIGHADFEAAVGAAAPDDFVYFDPPYVPLSETAWFAHYGAGGFGQAEHGRLARLVRDLGRRRVRALLSNSDCGLTRRLYEGLPVESIEAARSINSVASRRGPVGELLVRSFDYARTRGVSGKRTSISGVTKTPSETRS